MVGYKGKKVGENIKAAIATWIPSFEMLIRADNYILSNKTKYVQHIKPTQSPQPNIQWKRFLRKELKKIQIQEVYQSSPLQHPQ